jgi:hypothetical protein
VQERTVLLRLLLIFVAALVIQRVLRLLFRGAGAGRVRERPRRRGLDPKQAVSAKWTEVPEESEGRREE